MTLPKVLYILGLLTILFTLRDGEWGEVKCKALVVGCEHIPSALVCNAGVVGDG